MASKIDDTSITFIVPCYNPKISDLKRCLESFSDQLSKEDKIIVVNDGSDNKKEIESLVKEFKNTTLITIKTNQGVSNARNKGIEKTTTKWLTFVDADDTILPNTISNIRKSLSLESDIIIGGLRHHTRTSTHSFQLYDKENDTSGMKKEIICPRAFLKNEKTKCVGIATGKFYRTSFVKNSELSFCKNIKRAEDHIFFLDALAKNPTIKLIDCIFYSIEYNENSTTRKYTDNLHSNFAATINELEKRVDKTNQTEKRLLQARKGDYLYQSLINEFRPENQRPFSEKRKRAEEFRTGQDYSLKEFKKIIKKKQDKLFLFILQHHFYITATLLLQIFYNCRIRRVL